MRVRVKLIAMALLVTTIPLGLSSWQTLRLHQTALKDTLLRLHATAAVLGSHAWEQNLAHAKEALRASVRDTIDWEQLTEEERKAALWLVYGQFPHSAVVTLTAGGMVVERVRLGKTHGDDPGHPRFTVTDVGEFDRSTPPAREEGAFGAPFLSQAGAVILPITIALESRPGLPRSSVALGLDMSGTCGLVGQSRPEEGHVLLLDRWNQVVCKDGAAGDLTRAEESLLEVLAESGSGYSRKVGSSSVHGTTLTSAHGFTVVVEQAATVIGAPANLVLRKAFGWLGIGALSALVVGWLVARDIVVPLERLGKVAQRIGRGEFDQELIFSDRKDEIADLALSLRTMAKAVEDRDSEIQAWNMNLQARVEERSRQLEEAQSALLRSKKMAGLAVTTAGIAHEMNNPLTSILGLSQVLRNRARGKDDRASELSMLDSIVQESKRIEGMLLRMKSLDCSPEHSKALRAIPILRVLDSIVLAFRSQATDAGAVVHKKYGCDSEVLGDPYQLNAIFTELFSNALWAVSGSNAVRARDITLDVVQSGDDWVDVRVADSGCGIDPAHVERVFEPFFTTKQQGSGQGLGLSQVYAMVEAQGGYTELESRRNEGTSVKVRLPVARTGALLA